MTIDMLSTLYEQGIILVPTRARADYIVSYSVWRNDFPEWEPYSRVWSANLSAFPEMLCGVGNMCAIDVDEKNLPGAVAMFEAEMQACLPHVFEKLYIEETASGGRHYFFKTTELDSIDLAFAAQEQTLEDLAEGKTRYRPFVEYKGTNRLCRVAPGDGLAVIQGDITQTAHISPDDIRYLKYIASLLNQKPEEKRVLADQRKTTSVTIDTPGQDFSDNAPVEAIVGVLERHGWKVVKGNGYRGRITLRRPDAKTKGVDADILNRVFACWSSSEGRFETGKGYSFFAVYALLEHGGNYSEAAKALKTEGYGRKIDIATPAPQEMTAAAALAAELGVDPPEEEDPLWAKIQEEVMKMDSTDQDTWSVYFKEGDNPYNMRSIGVMEDGLMCVVGGREKSRKTTLLTAIVASMLLDGEERCGWSAKTWGNIVWLDTEQPRKYARKTRKRILIQAMMDEVPDRLKFFPLKGFKGAEAKLAAAKKILGTVPDISVVIIDGVVDLCANFNDEKASRSLINEIESWQEPDGQRGRQVYPVIHMNKGDRELRGHAGTMLGQKADVVLNVIFNEETTNSEVTFARARDVRPNAFEFLVIGDNIPHIPAFKMPNYSFLRELKDSSLRANAPSLDEPIEFYTNE